MTNNGFEQSGPFRRTRRNVAVVAKWMLRHKFAKAYLKPLANNGDAHSRLWFDPLSSDDLRALHDEIRSDTGIARGRGGCVVTSHEIGRDILQSPKTFRSLEQTLMLPGFLAAIYRWAGANAYADPFEPPSIVGMDGHRLVEARAVLRLRLQKSNIDELSPAITEAAKRLTVALDQDGAENREVDIAHRYCRELSLEVLSLFFGLPSDQLRDVCMDAEQVSSLIDLGLSLRQSFTLARAADRIDRWTGEQIENALENSKSAIRPAVQAMHDGRYSAEEVRRMVNLMLVAGYTTTVSVLTSGIKLLVENPDQLKLLDETPELWPNAVEEILRLAGPVMIVPRFANESKQWGAAKIGAQRPIYISGANADPEHFVDPYRFDVTRKNAKTHLSFGGGTHLCLGAPLARVELEIGLRTFFEAYRGVSIVTSERGAQLLVRSWNSLTVRLPEKRD